MPYIDSPFTLHPIRTPIASKLSLPLPLPLFFFNHGPGVRGKLQNLYLLCNYIEPIIVCHLYFSVCVIPNQSIFIKNAETPGHRDTGPNGLQWVCAEDQKSSTWHQW